MEKDPIPCKNCISLAICKSRTRENKRHNEGIIGEHLLDKNTGFTSLEFWSISPVVEKCTLIQNYIDGKDSVDRWNVTIAEEKKIFDYMML